MRLIDADALEYELGVSDRDIYVRECLEDAPTIEQPDIVRCTNCRYNDGTAYCELHFRDVEGNDFCSWGEVKE